MYLISSFYVDNICIYIYFKCIYNSCKAFGFDANICINYNVNYILQSTIFQPSHKKVPKGNSYIKTKKPI